MEEATLRDCPSCGAALDTDASACAACGADAPLAHLTGILGVVCRHCDAYNDPGARACVSCGTLLGSALTPVEGLPAVSRATAAARAVGAAAASAQLVTPVPGALVRCPRCGAEADAAEGGCARCGAVLVDEVEPAAAPRGGRVVTVEIPVEAPAALQPAPARALRPATPSPGAGLAPAARLVLERGEAPPGTSFPLGPAEAQAGRAHGPLAFPSDPCLAPLHASFSVRDGVVLVRDEGAAGGVFVRLRGVSVPLRAGTMIALGDHLLRFGGFLTPPPPPSPDGTRRLGAPRPDGPAVVVEEWLEGGVGGRVWLRTGPSVTIGRAGCAINLGDDPYLSQAHAEIAIEGEGVARLRDLGSSNGTFVRIPPGAERELHDGDAVRLGREVLRVEVG